MGVVAPRRAVNDPYHNDIFMNTVHIPRPLARSPPPMPGPRLRRRRHR